MKNAVHVIGKETDLDRVQDVFSQKSTIGFHLPGYYVKTEQNKVQKELCVVREKGEIVVSIDRPEVDAMEAIALSNAVKDVLKENSVSVITMDKIPDALVIQSTKKTGVGKFLEQVFG